MMADASKNDQETTSKKKKRPRINSIVRYRDDSSCSLYEENFAESYMKKLSQKLDENSFYEMLSILEEFETSGSDVKKLYNRIEVILKDHEDLLREFLGFLEPCQAYECGKLMLFFEIQNIKQFVCNLMFHFKRQPHLLNKILDKLCLLTEQENIQLAALEEAIIPFLQKNSTLVQQFYQLLPAGKPPDWFVSSGDSWEDFSIDCEVMAEETFQIPSQLNDSSAKESKNCIYGCEQNEANLCPICNVKFINGRMYVVNGKILHPAQIIFDPSEQMEQIRRVSDKSSYFVPTLSKPRNSKKCDVINKDTNDGRLSPIVLGTESEEEIGENELHRRKRKRKSIQSLKIRFDVEKKEAENSVDINQADDTALSNDEISCDEAFKEDNEYNSCDDAPLGSALLENNVIGSCPSNHSTNKEIVKLGDMELNFSKSSLPWSIKTHSADTKD